MAEARPDADGETEPALYEKFLLDDLDSYWDDLHGRLTVSRMVSDSVIKGMVNAVSQEAAEKIAAKEAEISLLSEMLLLVSSPSSASNYSAADLGRLRIAVDEKVREVEESVEAARTTGEAFAGIYERVDELRSVVAVAFERIDSMFCSIGDSAFEQRWEHDVEREVMAIAIQSTIRSLCKESEAKLRQQRRDFNVLYMNWQKKMAEIKTLREELDVISKSLSSEPGSLSSHHSFEIFEEGNAAKARDNFPRNLFGNHQGSCVARPEENGKSSADKSGNSPKAMIDLADSVHLKHMTKEEVMSYYNTEVMKMRRQYDQALLEKTEELFKFKRDFLKEKGSSHFRKDKEFETLRRRIPEVILKLDNVLLEKDNSSVIYDHHDEQLVSLNDKIDALLDENQRLRGCLRDKRREVMSLASQVSDAANQRYINSSTETNFLKQIRKLKEDLEDVKIEADVRDGLNSCILKETICEHKCGAGDVLIEVDIVQEIYSVIYGGVFVEAMSTMNSFISKVCIEDTSRETDHSEKEKAVLKMEENKKLEQEIMSFSTLVKEKEKAFLSQVEENKKLKQEIMSLSTLVQEKEKAFLSQMEENKKLNQEIMSLSTLVEEKEKAFLFGMEENKISKQEIMSLSTLVEEKEKAFLFELEENKKLKQEVMSLSTLVKEKEKFASEAGSALVQQKDHFDLINKELSILREQVYKQEILISDKNNELDLVKCKLNEAMEQVSQREMSLDVLNQRFKIASDSLDEADEENTMLRDSIEDMQTKLAAFVARDKEQVNQLEGINNSMEEFSRAVAGIENKLVDRIQRNRYRLETLSHQCTSLTEQVSRLREKEMWYTQIIDLKSSNLQKAESEVDLLGDEVDALLSLLGKIYIALDHYSPVFELYPGVMDILKLVQRELEGETIRSV